MQCVILAGGLGTRISSVAADLPKALIPVGGQPFALRQLAWLAAQGVSEVVYCIGHKGGMIQRAVGDGWRFGMKVVYCDEGDQLRGTGGAIRLALERDLLASGFFVLYADSYLSVEIEPVWRHSQAGREPTMVVIQNDGRWDASNVSFRDGRVCNYEKNLADPAAAGMRFIDYGLSVLNPRIIETGVPATGRFDLAGLYTSLSRDGQLQGYEVLERFYEIGSPAGLAELEAHLTSLRDA